jgi:hypothetical protein
MKLLCLECNKYVPILRVKFQEQDLARRRFEERNSIYPNKSILGYCENCFKTLNEKHLQNAINKYKGVIEMEEKETPMGNAERKGRLLFNYGKLLDRYLTQIEKLPEK